MPKKCSEEFSKHKIKIAFGIVDSFSFFLPNDIFFSKEKMKLFDFFGEKYFSFTWLTFHPGDIFIFLRSLSREKVFGLCCEAEFTVLQMFL